MKLDAQTGIVLLNMGGPDSVAAVEPFLFNIFADPLMIRLPWYIRPFQKVLARRISRSRGDEARHNYESIGGESPLLRITAAQANGAAALLGCEGYVAMRYWHPFATETVALMLAEGMTRAVALSCYPQHSRSTSESGVDDFALAWKAAGKSTADLLVIDRWPDHSPYVEAVANTLRETVEYVRGKAAHVLFSAHGLPERYIRQGDRYRDDIQTTLDAVVARCRLALPYSLSFQSKVGPEKWLGPSTPETIDKLADDGVKNLVIVPLGFISDHVETLQEIDLLFAGQARRRGMVVYRVPSLNDRPDFLHALAALVRVHATPASSEVAAR